MQNIVVDKPYAYIRPHRGLWWPNFIQRFRLIDRWLRKSHGVVAWEMRHADRLKASLAAGHGILLTPNHPRPCDPIAMGWLAREVNTHVFAMASWHLFNQGRFSAFAIRKMGGFSVYREGIDRQSINESVEILANAERPLILFPEGGVTRTNDRLQALLDGVAFIARTGAKKRQQQVAGGQVVVHPVALKYLLQTELETALDPLLSELEHRLSWHAPRPLPLDQRITRIGMALLALKEIEHLGRPQTAHFEDRLQTLIDHLLKPLEQEWLGKPAAGGVIARVKAIRMQILPEVIRGEVDSAERERRWRQLSDLYLAQQIASYPPDYLTDRLSRDRLLETAERFEEDLTDRVRIVGPLKLIMDVAPAIPVSPQRDRSQKVDPLMSEIATVLQHQLDELSHLSPPFAAAPTETTA